jgi:hypothetical protein
MKNKMLTIIMLIVLAIVVWQVNKKFFEGEKKYLFVIDLAGLISGWGSEMRNLAMNVAMFESGHFTSNIFKNNHNAFGMMQPKIRKTTSIGDKDGFATYSNLFQSARDFFLWCKDRGLSSSSTYKDGYEIMVSAGYMGTAQTDVDNYTAYMMRSDRGVHSLVIPFLLWVFLPLVVIIIIVVITSSKGSSKTKAFFSKMNIFKKKDSSPNYGGKR